MVLTVADTTTALVASLVLALQGGWTKRPPERMVGVERRDPAPSALTWACETWKAGSYDAIGEYQPYRRCAELTGVVREAPVAL
jgi:hypothetical protein